ncbi:MAG: hypothetical protein ACRCZ0_05740 [Cetobacterium sp.]
MSIINIVLIAIASIFVLLLFSKSNPVSPIVTSRLPYRQNLTVDPLFDALVDDEKKLDDNEKKFNKDYDEKNKEIGRLQKELNVCITNRTNINNAIQKFRDEIITNTTNTYNIKQQEVKDCDVRRNLRIDKYIQAYNKLFKKNISKQEVINKIATGSLNTD